MIEGKTIVVGLVALIIGVGAGFALRPVIAPANPTMATTGQAIAARPQTEPRGTQYFAAHLHEARQIVAQCRDGSVRGAECVNADAAVTEAAGRERFKKFMGN